MIPYVPAPVFWISGYEISAFRALLFAALLVGSAIALSRARRLKIDGVGMRRMGFWAIVCGFGGAHLAKVAMDHTAQFLADPSMLFRAGGIRSLGGFVGGFLGALAYMRVRRVSLFESFRMLDVVAFALPFAWMIGRLGCTLAHDHRGEFTTSWIAVLFPEGPRFDLGLIEFLFLIGFSALFYWLDRNPRPVGFFFVLFGVGYGGFRMWLDTLHVQPFRFYGGAFGVAVGLAGWVAMNRLRGRGDSGSDAAGSPLVGIRKEPRT